MALRRDFDLLTDDHKFLDDYGLPWESLMDSGQQWVLVHEFPSQHDGYNSERVTIAIRLETGYPNAALDMVYVYPALARKDGLPIRATDAPQNIDGRIYQRWSRHRTTENPWKPGQDNIGTHIFLIEDWFAREFERCPLR
jgi:hypothetical protein